MADVLPGDNRPPVYYDPDGKLVVRASSIGTSCLWELIAAGQGHEPSPIPENLKRAFREGHELEAEGLARAVSEHGVDLDPDGAQREGSLELPGGVIVRYHPDGLGSWVVTRHDNGINPHVYYSGVVEVKWLSHDLWRRAAKHGVETTIGEYKWQASVMMYGEAQRTNDSPGNSPRFSVPLLWVVGNKGYPPGEDGVKPYCEDEGKIFTQTVDIPFVTLSEIILRAMEIKELVEGEDVLESGRPCDDPSHFPCRYLHLRPEVEEVGPTEAKVRAGSKRDRLVVDVEDQDRVDDLVRSYIYHKGQADEAIEARDRAKAELLALLPGKATYETGRYTIPVIEQDGQSRIMWDEMTDEEKSELKAHIARFSKKSNKSRFLRGVKGKA